MEEQISILIEGYSIHGNTPFKVLEETFTTNEFEEVFGSLDTMSENDWGEIWKARVEIKMQSGGAMRLLDNIFIPNRFELMTVKVGRS